MFEHESLVVGSRVKVQRLSSRRKLSLLVEQGTETFPNLVLKFQLDMLYTIPSHLPPTFFGASRPRATAIGLESLE